VAAPLLRLCAVLLVVAVLAGGCAGSCTSKDASEEQQKPSRAARLAAWTKRIEEHRELVRQGATLSDEQRELFADAYYGVGVSLFRERKRTEAEAYLREALRLWPKHARAMLRLGDLYAAKREFKAAAQAYEQAGKLDVALRQTVRKRRTRLANLVLLVADQRLRDSQVTGAKQVLEFVETYLGDVAGDEVRERLRALEPLLRAERLLAEGKEAIARHPKDQGYKKLRQVATEYPRTYFAQEANRLLEENGQKIVLHDTATGYKLPPHWRRTTTQHFEIYYEKNAALTGAKRVAEDAFARITRTFGMGDIEWKTRIAVYLFSDDEAWANFVVANKGKAIMEWSAAFAVPWGNEMYMHVSEDKSTLLEHVLPHELAHVMHHRYVGGVYQPIFLKEGIAISMEKDGVKDARDEIERRVQRGAVYPLKQLIGFTEYPERDVRLFYAQSATVVGFIIHTYGLDGLKEFMFAFKDTPNAAVAIEEVFGISLDTFEAKWKKYAR